MSLLLSYHVPKAILLADQLQGSRQWRVMEDASHAGARLSLGRPEGEDAARGVCDLSGIVRPIPGAVCPIPVLKMEGLCSRAATGKDEEVKGKLTTMD